MIFYKQLRKTQCVLKMQKILRKKEGGEFTKTDIKDINKAFIEECEKICNHCINGMTPEFVDVEYDGTFNKFAKKFTKSILYLVDLYSISDDMELIEERLIDQFVLYMIMLVNCFNNEFYITNRNKFKINKLSKFLNMTLSENETDSENQYLVYSKMKDNPVLLYDPHVRSILQKDIIFKEKYVYKNKNFI